MQAVQATAAAEAARKANSSKARIELEEQMKERQLLMLQQQVGTSCANCNQVLLSMQMSLDEFGSALQNM